MVEAADDLQTAKGLWVVRGLVEKITPAGPVSFWDFSYWAVDFILEDDAWKIWHMLDLREINARQGDPTDVPDPLPVDPAFAEMASISFPLPTKPCTLRSVYRARTVPLPLPPAYRNPIPRFPGIQLRRIKEILS